MNYEISLADVSVLMAYNPQFPYVNDFPSSFLTFYGLSMVILS